MIMTIDKFHEIENKVIGIITDSFEKAINISISDFILLVARGGYHKHLDKPEIDLTPFVIEDRRDFLIDLTRRKFFVKYINDFVSRLQKKISMSDDEKEFDTNIQLMIYTHIWESHLFLNQLVRLAKIQLGMGYDWKAKLVYPKKEVHHKKSNLSHVKKGPYIENSIINRFEKSDYNMAQLIKFCYLKDLRDDFAHSSYYIDNNMILSNGNELFCGPFITIDEWEDKFVSSMLLSYHLNDMLLEYKNQFIDTFGDNPIEIQLPLKKNQNKKVWVFIKPERIEGKEEKVRFRFVKKDEIEDPFSSYDSRFMW